MEPTTIHIRLLPGSEDAPLTAAGFQDDLRAFEQSLRAGGLTPSVGLDFLSAAGSDTPVVLTGCFGLAATALSVLGTLLGAWLNAKFGRKVHLKIGADGEIEADAQTAADVEQLLAAARSFQKIDSHKS